MCPNTKSVLERHLLREKPFGRRDRPAHEAMLWPRFQINDPTDKKQESDTTSVGKVHLVQQEGEEQEPARCKTHFSIGRQRKSISEDHGRDLRIMT